MHQPKFSFSLQEIIAKTGPTSNAFSFLQLYSLHLKNTQEMSNKKLNRLDNLKRLHHLLPNRSSLRRLHIDFEFDDFTFLPKLLQNLKLPSPLSSSLLNEEASLPGTPVLQPQHDL